MSNKPGGLRRAGRRQSTPASPTSPTFLRRSNKSQDVFSPADSAFADSPSIDLTVPSPTFDLASISPALASGNRFSQRPQPTNRASDDLGNSRPKFLAEMMRPATSSAEGSSWTTSQARHTYSPNANSSRDSSLFSGARTSNEEYGRPSNRENQESLSGPLHRSSQHDRVTGDDGAGGKGTAGAKKSRFHLKSPISLFARRRSSQNTNKIDEVSMGVGKMHVPAMPDNIETSIRGSIVHDFSAPRNRRSHNECSPRPAPVPSPSYPRRPSELSSPSIPLSVSTPPSQHSPMFREHFQEERRPVQPTNTAYLHVQSFHVPSSNALPSFAKRLPVNLPAEEGPATVLLGEPVIDEPALEAAVLLPPEPDMPPPPPPPTDPPPPAPETTPSPVLDLPPVSSLPKHMTSTSSRFSFQIGQQGSIAQEKFLEEKHKEQASKMPAAVRFSVASVDDMDDYDYENDMDDEDGFDNGGITIRNIDMPSSQAIQSYGSRAEEAYGQEDDDAFDDDEFVIKNIDIPSYQIPQWSTTAVEEDYGDDDEENDFGTEEIVVRNIDIPTSRTEQKDRAIDDGHQPSLQGFHFTPQSLSFSPSTAQYTSMSTPRDLEGFAIGMAESKESAAHDFQPQIRNSLNESSDATIFEGLGISNLMGDLHGKGPLASQQSFDDLYFDDGEFDGHVVESDTNFNEDMLDDAEQIKDIPAENERKYEEALQRNLPGDRIKTTSGDTLQSVPGVLQDAGTHENEGDILANKQNGLTEGNLAAYHDALALAATQAAANGKFDRTVTFSRNSDDGTDSPFHNSAPALSSRGSKYSNNMIESGISDEDGYGFEDDLDDDAMIAAANAEALENDDDGFYGQEFGFYARAYARDTAEFSSGGYFTSRGSNGIKRSHSGKNNFQEPNLTPITERSEWSTRNSVASLPLHAGIPGAGQSLPSPGIAELIGRDSPIVDDEMSMGALMKWRSKTFGGSSTSINSLVDRHLPHSSPLGQLSGYNSGLADSFAGRMSSPTPGRSAMSIAESEDEDEDWGRATLTQNTPHKKHVEPVSPSPQEQLPSSPTSRKGHHSRNSSGAESVSYARDTDGRWVLERRRTGDDGELELVEREYLAGMRI